MSVVLGSSCLVKKKKKKTPFVVFDASFICFWEMMNRISIAIFGLSFGLSCHCVHICVQFRGVIKCKSYTQHVIVCMFYKNGRSVFIGTLVKLKRKLNGVPFCCLASVPWFYSYSKRRRRKIIIYE